MHEVFQLINVLTHLIGRPRKRWRDQLHFEDQGTGNTPNPSGTYDYDDDDVFPSSGV